MTKKDYILLAKALSSALTDDAHTKTWEDCVAAVGQALAQDNLKFNPETFVKACKDE